MEILHTFAVTTFNNFTATTAGTTLNFKASQNAGFSGTLTVTGAGSNPIFIASDSAGTKWNLNLSGTASITLAYIKESFSSGKSEFELVANKATLFSKGYLSLYKDLTGKGITGSVIGIYLG